MINILYKYIFFTVQKIHKILMAAFHEYSENILKFKVERNKIITASLHETKLQKIRAISIILRSLVNFTQNLMPFKLIFIHFCRVFTL